MRRIDYGAARLIAEMRTIKPHPRLRQLAIAVREYQALLQAPQVLCAGDDLLARVATLLETDAM